MVIFVVAQLPLTTSLVICATWMSVIFSQNQYNDHFQSNTVKIFYAIHYSF